MGLTPNSIQKYTYTVSNIQNKSIKTTAAYKKPDEIWQSLKFKKPAKAIRLLTLKVLIVDEVSMISNEFFDLICKLLQTARGNSLPFGGVKIIFVGDLCQLPPVSKDYDAPCSWIIDSEIYQAARVTVIQFTKCFRQSDPEFQSLLSRMRFGSLTQKQQLNIVKMRERNPEFMPHLQPTIISGSRADVAAYNSQMLREHVKASGNKSIMLAVQYTAYGTEQDYDCSSFDIDPYAELAVGCVVIVTRNLDIDNGVVNGAQGVVTGIAGSSITLDLYNGKSVAIEMTPFNDPFVDDQDKPLFSYLPVILGYSVTIHKVQGMTLDLVQIDFRAIWSHGQAYTAVSRVRDIRGLSLIRLKSPKKQFVCDSRIRDFYQDM